MAAQGIYGSGGDVPLGHHAPNPMLSTSGGADQDVTVESDRLRSELEQITGRQREIMELLHCKSPDRIVHDLRNMLNELNLYRSLVENDA